jgi:hypothetical protein
MIANREPGRPEPRSTRTANAPATPTNLSVAADAQATYPVGRITRQAQDQVAELPPPARPVPLEPPIAEIGGDSHEDLIAELVKLAGEVGYTVVFGNTGAADGLCNAQSKRIAVAERLEANGQLAALIHELAHALVAEDPDAPRLDYAQGELIAESVVFSPCQGAEADEV